MAMPPFREQEEKMFSCLTEKELGQLDQILLKLLPNWSQNFEDE